MKTLTTAALGAIALATTLGFAQPAAARGNVGVYVGPNGIGISVYRERCRDNWYRRNHWNRCSAYYRSDYDGYYDGYYNDGYYNNYYNDYYYYNGRRYHRHHDRDDHRDRDRHHDRDHRGW